ncbi:MAG TPA: DUF58 domain-containing protein, partial [Candidatus Acidoferrales bacterium]|nr:DUF58 domain-containing protein [Candidatus Acidoferrales bacterium]
FKAMIAPLTLDPGLSGNLDDLVLLAKEVVEGALSGLHRSPFLGYSSEFSSYRPYIQGDNLRFVDWKVWGRTDKLYVKQFEDDTNLTCQILLDASASMDFGRHNKFHYGRLLAMALAYLMSRQHDAVGLALISQGTQTALPPHHGPQHLDNIFTTLARTVAEGHTLGGSDVARVVETFNRRGLTVIISDLMTPGEEACELLRQLRSRRQEVIVFHVMAAEELDFELDGEFLFEDAESGATIPLHAGAFRKEYLERVREFRQWMEKECEKLEADYQLVRTDQPVADVLPAYLERRMAV